ncbi:helix-turn-helix transcriptional regulator [Actinophytocola sp.]|uniref:helix-turn-helix transcriptional regulator n=1 Tax=Actinophytocola sp. TaxID=1872138 RepID=UPI003899A8E1
MVTSTQLPVQVDAAETRRRELAEFLRSRRERITPEQVGLPHAGRRRTPGLRREEVAQLAGVGVTWYTWLEQGRDIKVSEHVLEAIARTLRLDPHERVHLFTLAGAPEPPRDKDCRAIPSGVHVMLAKLDPLPAVVVNALTDIMAYNRGYDFLMDVSSLPETERNATLQVFTNPDWQRRLPDWQERADQLVGQLRGTMAKHVGEPAWKSLVKRLRRESPEFEKSWQRHEVRPMRNLTKRFQHHEVGMLNFEYTYLWLGQRSELRMTTYTPADEETATKLATLF